MGSAATLAAALLLLAVVSVYLAARVVQALPNVGRDVEEREPWTAPLGVESVAGFVRVHVPRCAQGPVTGLFLWDDDDRGLWRASGLAPSLTTFVVGAAPAGLQADEPPSELPRGRKLRVGVVRAGEEPAGATFELDRLREGRVRYLDRWMSVEQFTSAAECESSDDESSDEEGDPSDEDDDPSAAGGT